MLKKIAVFKNLKLITSLIFILISQTIVAQTFSIKGTVTAKSTGEPLSSVTVVDQQNNNATITDANGNFTLEVPDKSILTFSSVGYKSLKINIDRNNTSVNVLLEQDDDVLNEVVVTALGIQRKKSSLAYATQQISSDELNRTPTTNFVNNLSGKIAGLQVTSSNTLGGSSNVILRGFKSLTQSNQALFVVDGVPFDNSNQSANGYDLGNVASDINPDDIESVNVLKGAAASALYGSRAANGVIVITTKKGRSSHDGLGITVNQGIQIGTVDKSTLPKYQTEYGQGHGSAGYNSSYPDQTGFFYYTPAVGSNGQPVNIVQTDWDLVWGPAYNPDILAYNWNAFSPGNANFGKATPWVAANNHEPTDFFTTPITNITSIYVNGGGDKGTFKAGYTNNYEKGILPNSHIEKSQFNFGATYNITDKLAIGGVVYYIDETGLNRDSYDFRATNSIVRDFRQWWPTNVDLKEQKDDYFNTRTNDTWNWLGGYTTAAIDNIPPAAYHNNPYWILYENYNNDARQRYFGNINLNYKLTDYLSLMARISRDSYDQLFETRIAVGSYQTPAYTKYRGSFAETNYDVLINFNKDISKDLNLKALLGGNVRKNLNTSDYASTNGGLVVPHYYALSNSLKTPAAPTEVYAEKEVDGVFAGATLGYREILTLDATIRRDQSSALPKNNNAYYYPSVSGNFIFSKLFTSLSWLSYGKLRANYAEVGNDAPVYSLQNTYTAGTPFNSQTIFYYTSTNNNQNLVPEKNRTYEAGLEAALLDNRVGFDVTYYHSTLINQIMPVSPSTATGFTSFYVNGGTVQNQGVEVTLNVAPVRTKNILWNVIINWSKNENKVISLYGGQPTYTIATLQNSIQLVAEVGKSYGILRGTDYEYLNGQRLIGTDGYPVKSANTKSDIGNINPDWTGGITNTINYKNLSLSFLVDFKHGGDVYSLDMDYGSWAGVYAETAGKNDLGHPLRNPLDEGGGIILQGVTADGKPNKVRVDAYDINKDGSKFPFSSVNSLAAKSYVYDASYIKLREVALAYSIPLHTSDKAGFIKGIDLFLTGRNLWIIHKNLPYSDPEQGEASTTLSSSAPIIFNPNATIGYQSGAYPNVRQYAFNVKLKF